MILILMGVSGSGKTTIGTMLSKKLGWDFYDGDDFHPLANISKMSRGIPLTDEDRATWLDVLASLIQSALAQQKSIILACSALKQAYRERLALDAKQELFVYLKGSYEQILERMQLRPGHYMKPSMLASQFATLEEPADALILDIALSPDEILNRIINVIKPG